MQCVANTLFLTLEQVLDRNKSLSVYSLPSQTLRNRGKGLATRGYSKNLRGSGRLRGIQYRVSLVLVKYISIASVPFGGHFYGVTPRDLITKMAEEKLIDYF